jgi:hypothetical protein
MEVHSMTVTRKQGETGENSLVHRHDEQLTTSQPPTKPSPSWLGLALQIAQDKRHDIAAPTLRLWKEKLKKFSDQAVCDALMTGKWELFLPWIR